MYRGRGLVLVTVLVASAAAGCARIESPPLPRRADAMFETMPFPDAIPASYGDLVSVTPSGDQSYGATLWFRRDDGAVVVVGVNFARGTFANDVLVIPRR